MRAYDLAGRPLVYGALNRTYIRNPVGQFAVNTKATDGFFPAAYAEAENPYPKLRATDDPLALADDEFFDAREHYRHLTDSYYRDGVKVASSRDTPAKYPALPLGTWKLDNFEGIHGREIDQLRELDPNDLELAEAGDVESNQAGKGWDAERYLTWLQSGLQPPPVTVIETEGGKLRVIDGHRRTWAAKQAGKPVRAWVSPLAPTGALDVSGKPIKSGMTRELLRKWIAAQQQDREREQYGRSAVPVRYGAQAPAGGVTIRGRRYRGGQFIPDEVLQAATAEEREAVASGESRRKPLVPDGPTRLA